MRDSPNLGIPKLGVLVVDKPLGFTSHDVVAKLRRVLGTRRIGHAGTLDPLATGVLVVAVGPATRFLQYLPLEPKIYTARVTFGRETASYDAEGDVIREAPVPEGLFELVQAALPSFLGLQEQIPPMYSAVKVNGRPLYDYARKGHEIERRPRTIHIADLQAKDLGDDEVEIEVECSGGTYIRTLAHDLGQKLGCGAHLSGLVRTRVGRFTLADATSIENVSPERLLDLREALSDLPSLLLTEAEEAKIRNGVAITLPEPRDAPRLVLLSPTGPVVGIATTGEKGVPGNVARPECVLPIEARL